MTSYSKNDVLLRGSIWDTIGDAVPAICVKSRHFPSTDDVREKFGCSEEKAQEAIEIAWNVQCERFWHDYDGAVYQQYFGMPVVIESDGRSGGWLVVRGLPPLASWDAIVLAKWRGFEKSVKENVRYHESEEAVFETIEANGYAE